MQVFDEIEQKNQHTYDMMAGHNRNVEEYVDHFIAKKSRL